MQPATLPVSASARRPTSGAPLCLAELNHAEHTVIRALRRGLYRVEHEQEHLDDLGRAVERYLRRAPASLDPLTTLANDELGEFEACTVHALTCLRAGLLGEAWKTLVPLWGHVGAGKALLRLQDVADVLQLRARHMDGRQGDPSFFREAGLI